MRHLPPLAALALLAGCAAAPEWLRPAKPKPEPVAKPAPAPEAGAAVRPPASARTAEEFDTTSAADKAAAAAPSADGRDLGTTIASLGAPGEPGFWLKTPLVETRRAGRVSYAANGKSVKLDLIPLDAEAGAGSRISLAAIRVLEAPLTGLPELRVFALD
ncbi:hypothetical protein [Roseovarius aquimarinus]|uniref:D-galactarate dehydratase n=1 Tax=Roseovarius aquimarinus TaxID=1229156 RepID=A0ABW7I4Q7_9RHOB